MPTDEIKESQPMAQDPTALSEAMPKRSETFGEKAVGITFNVGNSGEVHQAKQLYANIIDQLNDLRNDPATSPEKKRLCSVAITESQGAQMWAVKAITWRD